MIDLGPGAVAVPDQPCNAQLARSVEPFIAAGFSDREAWESVFSDCQRLAWFRIRFGNDGQRTRHCQLDLDVQHPGRDSVRAADGSGD